MNLIKNYHSKISSSSNLFLVLVLSVKKTYNYFVVISYSAVYVLQHMIYFSSETRKSSLYAQFFDVRLSSFMST